MKTAMIIVGKKVLQFIYLFLKLLPTQNKIIFLSRQSNNLPLDFFLIQKELKNKNYKIVSICERLATEKEFSQKKFKMASNTLKTMYHLATSKVCVLDSYSLPVSILHHKKSLRVIQIWHSMGKIKQSGYQTLDKPSGRSSKMAKLLNMHKNYDIVVAGARAWNDAYCKSFGITEDKLWNIGLPRAAYIYNERKTIQKEVYTKYPSLKNKKVILYCPTFRVNNEGSVENLINGIDFDKYSLIISCHPRQKLKVDIDNKRVYRCEDINTFKLLTICDYFITDYSSLAVEAAALNKKTYYYLYDYEQYTKTNGLNFDPLKELPALSFKEANKLTSKINDNEYDTKTFNDYRKKYVPTNFERSTKRIVDYIKKVMNS